MENRYAIVNMKLARYIVYNQGNGIVRFFNLLGEALEFKAGYGGIIYEPLGMSTAEKVSKEPINVKYSDEVDE